MEIKQHTLQQTMDQREKITWKIRIPLEMNENESITYLNSWNAGKFYSYKCLYLKIEKISN